MVYSTHYYNRRSFSDLQKDWEMLQRGKDMTYFQQYSWYNMLNSKNPKDNSFYETSFVLLMKNNEPCIIAPLWIVKKTITKFNKIGIYILGRKTWSDYLNFIYKSIDKVDLLYLLEDVAKHYNIDTFFFEQLKENTELYNLLTEKTFNTTLSQRTTCVSLKLPSSEQEYLHLLSKSSRQNIRTAFNRADKDHIAFKMNFDDKEINTTDFIKFREERVKLKHEKEQLSFITRVKMFIAKCMIYPAPCLIPIADDEESKIMSIKTLSGDLCAAFNYGYNKANNEIVLMAVSTNPQYYRYSPGIILLYSFILDKIKNSEYIYIDFTRGDEIYKYTLGGKDHFISNLTLKY